MAYLSSLDALGYVYQLTNTNKKLIYTPIVEKIYFHKKIIVKVKNAGVLMFDNKVDVIKHGTSIWAIDLRALSRYVDLEYVNTLNEKIKYKENELQSLYKKNAVPNRTFEKEKEILATYFRKLNKKS